MDAERYAEIRELFLAADELPAEDRDRFVRAQAGDDAALVREVLELLGEHDSDAARIEGERSSLPSVERLQARRPPSGSESRSKRQTTASVPADSTLRWSQRTHAQPRFADEAARSNKPVDVTAPRVRSRKKSRPRWPIYIALFAVLLPILLLGWLLERRMLVSIQAAESAIAASSGAMAAAEVTQLLERELASIQSWAKDPRVRENALELVELSREYDDAPGTELSEALLQAEQSEKLRSAILELADTEAIAFEIWNRSGNTLATWSAGAKEMGVSISLSHVEPLSRVMRGESVFIGPERVDPKTGVADESMPPILAAIVPLRNESQRVEAALMVRGRDLYDRLDAVFDACRARSGGDYYLVSDGGVMMSSSPLARQLASSGLLAAAADDLATRLRVSDPGTGRSSATLAERLGQPLTTAAASVLMRTTGTSQEPYRNYAGQRVNGSWHWLETIGMGVVVERDYHAAMVPARELYWSLAGLAILVSSMVWGASYVGSQRTTSDEDPDPLVQYEIGEPLGTGGMGVVFRAKHRHLGRPTALKVLRQDRQEPDDLLRFDREARVAAALDSPHIVTVYDYGRTADGEFFTAMQLLRGLTLYEVVARSGALPIGRVLFILRQVCDAVIDAHDAGLLHRDIKPQNIMLSLDASVGDWAVVFDFGLAKPLHPIKGMYQTSEAIWAGTPMYMAPERFRDPTVMDLRSDIYSLGCVAYFLLTGRPPFSECDPESLFALILSHEPISLQTQLSEPVPESVEQLVRRCMAKDATLRFQSAQQFAGSLDALRNEFPWSTEQARRWWKAHGED